MENVTNKEKIYLGIKPEDIVKDLDDVINEELQTYFILNINCNDINYINEPLQNEIVFKVTEDVMKHISTYRITRLHYIFKFNDMKELKSFIEFRISLSVMAKVLEFNDISKENEIINTPMVDMSSNF